MVFLNESRLLRGIAQHNIVEGDYLLLSSCEFLYCVQLLVPPDVVSKGVNSRRVPDSGAASGDETRRDSAVPGCNGREWPPLEPASSIRRPAMLSSG